MILGSAVHFWFVSQTDVNISCKQGQRNIPQKSEPSLLKSSSQDDDIKNFQGIEYT